MLIYKKNQGLTLIEIMVVTAIISMIMGISSAFLSNFGKKLALKTSTYQISTLLKAAKNFSIQENSECIINIDQEEGNFIIWGIKTIGFWHFEEKKDTGAFNRNVKAEKVTLTKGKIGNCFRYEAGKSKVICEGFTSIEIQDGFQFTFWVYPERNILRKEQTLWQLDEYYNLKISRENKLYLEVAKKVYDTIFFPLYRWHHIKIVDKKNYISVFINDVERIKTFYKYSPLPSKFQILLGKNFQGKIDHAGLFSNIILDSYSLKSPVFIKTSPENIVFNKYGHLSSLIHSGSISIVLFRPGVKKFMKVSISPMGAIRTFKSGF